MTVRTAIGREQQGNEMMCYLFVTHVSRKCDRDVNALVRSVSQAHTHMEGICSLRDAELEPLPGRATPLDSGPPAIVSDHPAGRSEQYGMVFLHCELSIRADMNGRITFRQPFNSGKDRFYWYITFD
jgi:hypothetical protein